jgi:hypothetical protein
MAYVNFFFGTPKRLLYSILAVFTFWAILNFARIEMFFHRLCFLMTHDILHIAIVAALIFCGYKLIAGKKKK